MSSLRNEALLESIYDEVMLELEQKEQFRPLFTQEELEEGRRKLREERGVLNSILAPFGIAPFPNWL